MRDRIILGRKRLMLKERTEVDNCVVEGYGWMVDEAGKGRGGLWILEEKRREGLHQWSAGKSHSSMKEGAHQVTCHERTTNLSQCGKQEACSL